MNNLTSFDPTGDGSQNFEVRRQFDKKSQKWYFSVIDIIAVLIEQKDHKRAKSY